VSLRGGALPPPVLAGQAREAIPSRIDLVNGLNPNWNDLYEKMLI